MRHQRHHQHIVGRQQVTRWLQQTTKRSPQRLERDVVKMAGLSPRQITVQRLAEALGKLRKQLQVKVKLNAQQEVMLAMWVAVGIVVLIERRQDNAVRQLIIDALTCTQEILMERCRNAYQAREVVRPIHIAPTVQVIHDCGDEEPRVPNIE